ncbi:ubiquitin-like-specific protease ESD4 [Papaver somniferum]|nr:ubiquitin-like-specific protease ESD4 [Papaver somniferum]
MLVDYPDSEDEMDIFIENLVASVEKTKNSVFETFRRPFFRGNKRNNREKEEQVVKDVISVDDDDDDDGVDELVVVDEDDEIEVLEGKKKTEEKSILEELFAELTDEEKNEVELALSPHHNQDVLVVYGDIKITGEILQCLGPRRWLNDEVITVYLELLKEREKRQPEKFLKCHFFNPFFYQQLAGGVSGYDYKAVKRWTMQKKIGYGLIECDKIFVPIHQKDKMHWCLGVINKKDKKFQYLDSLKGVDTDVFSVLARYYVDEVKDKSGEEVDISTWKSEYVEDLPGQENGCDCGMFVLKYIDFYSRGLALWFNQKHMAYFRLRTAKEILRLRAD